VVNVARVEMGVLFDDRVSLPPQRFTVFDRGPLLLAQTLGFVRPLVH